jgi:hypothetical protein
MRNGIENFLPNFSMLFITFLLKLLKSMKKHFCHLCIFTLTGGTASYQNLNSLAVLFGSLKKKFLSELYIFIVSQTISKNKSENCQSMTWTKTWCQTSADLSPLEHMWHLTNDQRFDKILSCTFFSPPGQKV